MEGGEGESAVRWVSGTGGRGQSLAHLGSSSPSALDRLTCIHPPAQEGPRVQTHTHRVGVSPTHSHADGHMHTHKHRQTVRTASSYWRSLGGTLQLC